MLAIVAVILPWLIGGFVLAATTGHTLLGSVLLFTIVLSIGYLAGYKTYGDKDGSPRS